MKKMMLIFGMIPLLLSCSKINSMLGLQDDNIMEEVVEDVIKQETGLDMDLTPSSPEKKNTNLV